jgi:dienelactone hydrolase
MGKTLALFLFVLLGGCQSFVYDGVFSSVDRFGPQSKPTGPFHEQYWLIPDPENHAVMAATVWTPKGAGPYPLAVISHGSSQDPEERIEDPTPRYHTVFMWLLQHGYTVVLPVRLGHGRTGGPYLEDEGDCADPDYFRAGRTTAASIEATIKYMIAQPFISKDHVIVVGQSAGAWGALALAGLNPPALRGIIVFAPGRGGLANGNPNLNCAPGQLVATAAEFGRTARIPTFWINAKNDSYFGPDLSQRMANAYKAAGGQIDYHLVDPVKDEGHFLFRYPEAVAIWSPLLEAFLSRLP